MMAFRVSLPTQLVGSYTFKCNRNTGTDVEASLPKPHGTSTCCQYNSSWVSITVFHKIKAIFRQF